MSAGETSPSGRALVLASASPRRRELLARWGVHFVVDVANVVELEDAAADPAELTLTNAHAKLEAVRERHPEDRSVLAADTVVLVEGIVLGKPAGREDARRMLGLLAGRRHVVATAVAVARGERTISHIERTTVGFRCLDAAEIERYLDEAEWQDKAGAYAVQEHAGDFVDSLEGELDNVIGLPRAATLGLLAEIDPGVLGSAAVVEGES
jgi:septum formation protein